MDSVSAFDSSQLLDSRIETLSDRIYVTLVFKRKPRTERSEDDVHHEAICFVDRFSQSAIFPRNEDATRAQRQRIIDAPRRSLSRTIVWQASDIKPIECSAVIRLAKYIIRREREWARIVPSRGNSICGTLRRNPAPGNHQRVSAVLHATDRAPLSCPR